MVKCNACGAGLEPAILGERFIKAILYDMRRKLKKLSSKNKQITEIGEELF